MKKVILYFNLGELVETRFFDGTAAGPRVTVRGKTGGAFRSAGSFQWTSAVKALSLLMLKTASSDEQQVLRGEGNSLASSLDYAISKQPQWLAEMFGCDHLGICFIRRCILRTNPERKRPGPVTLAMNLSYLPAASIEINIDGHRASKEEMVRLSEQLERNPVVARVMSQDAEQLLVAV
jgi:hypothetical protein